MPNKNGQIFKVCLLGTARLILPQLADIIKPFCHGLIFIFQVARYETEDIIAPASVLFWTTTATTKYLCNKWTVVQTEPQDYLDFL